MQSSYGTHYSMQQPIRRVGWCPVEIDSINVSQLHLNSVLIVQYRSDVI